MTHWIIEDGQPKQVDLLTWARWMETHERHIAQTFTALHHISTIFLGVDHRLYGDGPPLLYETMVFGDDGWCGDEGRYSSREDAFTGHHAAVERIVRAEAEAKKLAATLLTPP